MCRIAGIINQSLSTDSLEYMVKDMCAILQHGGPDDEGTYTNEEHHFVLGNRRLSLIDLTQGGHQPMSYSTGRFHISFNGEIYNYTDLKLKLKQSGYTFENQTDTEVILAAFAAWGTASFTQLNGMFSFALWDNFTSILYLVRDAAGIKPLYYSSTKHGLAFASEMRAFKSIDYLQEPGKNWQVYLMAYGHLPEPVTTLHNVQPLPKGSYLTYEAASGTQKIQQFAKFTYTEALDNRKEAISEIRETLKQSVQRHLISDAPIGVFLSGGVDSAIIAILANNDKHTQLNTLSLHFEDNSYSEKKYQDLVLQNLNCRHSQYLLKQQEFHHFFPSVIKAMDLPSCDGINTWFISRLAKQNGLKAVLSGIGGDELYGGYPSFKRMSKALLLQRLPKLLLKAGHATGLKKIRRLAYLSINGAVGEYLFLRGLFVPAEIARHLNADEADIWKILGEQPQPEDISHLTPENQASWLEMNLYMQNQLLRDSDVMGMAHGVEIRVPFLDKEFLNLSLQLKSSIKYKGQLGKQLLIDAFKNLLPEPVWNRPKMGFSFPFKKWLMQDGYVKESFTSKHPKDLKHYQSFIKGDLHWSQLITLLLLQQSSYGD
jgi:asparagine synthase (glutamine-hydrolysing)